MIRLCNKKIYSSLSICYLLSTVSFAQEKLGIVHDNYLPMHQHRINPSAIVDQKPWISINVTGVEGYANGNFVYFPSDRLSPANSFETIEYNRSSEIMKGFIVGEVVGPSASMVLGRNSIAVHSRLRSYTAIDRFPAVIGQIVTDQGVENVEDGVYTITNGRGKTMSWFEVGFTYGRIVWTNPYKKKMLNAAVSVNRIYGIQQASFIVDEGKVLVKNAKGTLLNANGRYSFTNPKWKSGKGWSTNLGLTYKKMIGDIEGYRPHSKRGGCRRSIYRYKIGLSVIDLGSVLYDEGAFFASMDETTEVDDLEDVVEEEGIEAAVKKDGFQYSASLPTAASIQFDYNVGNGFYLNGTLLQNLTSPKNFGVERANLIAFAPRYESRKFGVGLPISMADYTEPQVGLFVRFGPLSLGSDHVLPFLTTMDIYGADVYFNINIQIFDSPLCGKGAGGRYTKWLCPTWE